MRTSFDFTPYRRSTVGFDRLFDMLESTARAETDTFPPFDIEQEGDERYRITLAVAGFRHDEIEIVAQSNQLTITGRKAQESETRHFLHRGIAASGFERRFQLADFVIVESADFNDGLLRVALRREVPEAMKPRHIKISGPSVRPANDRLAAPDAERDAA